MLPSPDELFRGLEFFARRSKPRAKFDIAALAEVIREAGTLSAGHVEDEPAALFWACARRPQAFGGAAHELVPMVAQNFAHRVAFDQSKKRFGVCGSANRVHTKFERLESAKFHQGANYHTDAQAATGAVPTK